jgi:hypothetical protein
MAGALCCFGFPHGISSEVLGVGPLTVTLHL